METLQQHDATSRRQKIAEQDIRYLCIFKYFSLQTYEKHYVTYIKGKESVYTYFRAQMTFP